MPASFICILSIIAIASPLLFFDALATGQDDILLNRYPLHANITSVDAMAADSNGNIWMIDSNVPALYRYEIEKSNFTEFIIPVTGTPKFTGISVDSSGTVWFADQAGNSVGRLSINGFKLYRIPVFIKPTDVLYKDGFLWIAAKEELGKLDISSASLTDYFVYKRNSDLDSLLQDDEGNIWFVETNAGKLGVFLKVYNGIDEIEIPAIDPYPKCLEMDSKGRAWFIQSGPGKLGMFDAKDYLRQAMIEGQGINKSRFFKELEPPAIDGKKATTYHLAIDGHDNIWFTDIGNNRLIAYSTKNDNYTPLYLEGNNSMPTILISDGTGILWFIESNPKKLVRLHVGPEFGKATPTPVPSVTATKLPTNKPEASPSVPGFQTIAAIIALLIAFKKSK
jgi:streptogramin lyase